MNPPSTKTETLRKVFCESLNLAPATPASGLDRKLVQSWDSLAHVTLLSRIEEEFGFEFDPEDYPTVTSYEAAATLLAGKGIL